MIPLSTIALLASPLFTLFLFGYVYGQRRENRLNHAFLTLAGTYFLLTLCDFIFRVIHPGTLRHALLAIATSLFFAACFVFLDFMYAFVKRKRDAYLAVFGIAACVGMVLPLANIPLHVDSFFAQTGIYVPLPNALFALMFVLYVVPVTLFSIGLALHAYKMEPDRADKKRLFLWICGMGAAFLYLVGVSFVFPRLLGMPIASSFTSLAIIIVDLFMYWSVRRYNFLTVNIRQLEEILDKVLKDVGDAILLVDQNRNIVRANDAAARFLGPQPAGAVSLYDSIPELSTHDSLVNFETDVRLSGERRSIVVTKTSLHAADETVHHMLTIRDITQERQAEEEQVRTQQLESLGVLAGGIAHDFNNLLCGIASSFALAKMNVDPHADVGTILNEGERAALSARSLTHQLLTFAKGGGPVFTVFDAVEVVRDACTFSTHGGRIKLEFVVPPEAIRIRADEGQLRQVFQNIALNASQAMSSGGVIRISILAKVFGANQMQPLAAGRYVEVSVTDRGCGIAPEVLPRIFEPYFSTKKGGTGLGLAIAYKIVKRHNGHITVSSEVGKGSVFTVCIPLNDVDTAPESRTAPKASTASAGRVLIMDDAQVIRITLSMLLRQLGYLVDEAATGEDAIGKFDQAAQAGIKYKMVITDLTVEGGMGGKDLAREIALRDPHIPIILSSGYSEDMEMTHYKEYGFAAVLRKPYSTGELKEVLESVG
jgi:signal transduction histidine kinase